MQSECVRAREHYKVWALRATCNIQDAEAPQNAKHAKRQKAERVSSLQQPVYMVILSLIGYSGRKTSPSRKEPHQLVSLI